VGRAKEYRQRLKYTVASARRKTLEQQLQVQLRSYLGLSRVESELLSDRISRWIVKRPDQLGANQMLFRAAAGRDAFGRGVVAATKEIVLTVFDIEDLDLEEEFGLAFLQLGRILRLIEEADRQDALLEARQLSLLCNIAPSSLRRRLQDVRDLGIWAPVRGLPRADREKGGLYRSTWVLSGYLQGLPLEDLRRQVAISRGRFGEILRRFTSLARSWHDGEADVSDSERIQWVQLLQRCSPQQLAELTAGRSLNGVDSCDWETFSCQLRADFALSPAKLSVITDLVAEVVSSLGRERVPGQVVHWAVVCDEPAGKPLSECQMVPVKLSYWDPSDEPDPSENRDANRLSDLKLKRIERFSQEAQRAGGYLTYADLSYLLGIHTAAISRMVRQNPHRRVPLRGSECDIGRGISHRNQIIELYLQMHSEVEIAQRTGHSLESVESYIKDFAKVLALSERGLTSTMIRRVTGRSMALVRAYLELVQKYCTSADYAFRVEHLRRIFYRRELDSGVKKSFGSRT
jgi:hypothetical protein